MDEKLLEVREYTGAGYKPLIDFGDWRVAILNYLDGVHPDRIDQMERHNETDEVFVLLRGQAILFLGEGEVEVEAVHPQVMEYCKVYNVKSHVWHTIAMSEEASVLITENRNTSRENSNYASLCPEHRQLTRETARRLYPGLWKELV